MTPVIRFLNAFYNIIETATRFGNSKTSLFDHIFVKILAMDIRSCTVDTDSSADHFPVIGSRLAEIDLVTIFDCDYRFSIVIIDDIAQLIM